MTPGEREDEDATGRAFPDSGAPRGAVQLAAVGALVLVAAAGIHAYGAEWSHDLRQTLIRLTPLRALVVAVGVAALCVVLAVVRPRGRLRARWSPGHARVPVVALLGLVVVAASAFRILLARAATEPRVLGDELVYSGLAKGLALQAQPVFRGELDLAHSLLYPLLLAPAHALAVDGARAYEATKTVNAVVVASAAVPAYLLARRVVARDAALVVAALVALEPWTAYASLVMTESLFLPVFTTFALLLALMLERPSPGRQVALAASLVMLIAVRPQALVLAGAVGAAIAIVGLRAPPIGRTLRTYAPLLALLVAGALAAVLALVAGVEAPGSSGRDVLEALLDPLGLVEWSLWTLAVYQLALGVVALAVFPLALHGLLRSPSPPARATGVALLVCSAALLLSVAAVSASPSGLNVLHERYVFYLTPLVLVGLAHWLRPGNAPSRRGVWLVAGLAVGIAATLPADQLARANNVDSPTAVWLGSLHEAIPTVPVELLVVGLAAFGALVLVSFRSPAVPFLAVAVAFAALACGIDYSGPFGQDQDRRLAWVDDALSGGERASLVHLGYSRSDQPCAMSTDYEQQGLVVLTEFFNTRVDRVLHAGGQEIERDNLESPSLTVGDGGVVFDGARPFAPGHVVLDSRQPIVGRRLARLDLAALGSQYQAGASLTLWTVDPPLRFLAHAQPLPPRADGRQC